MTVNVEAVRTPRWLTSATAGRKAVVLFVAACAVASAATGLVGVVPGTAANACVLLALVNFCAFAVPPTEHGFASPTYRLLLALMLIPLLRLVPLTMATGEVPYIWRPVVVGVPIAIAVAGIVRAAEVELVLARVRAWSRTDLIVGGGGIIAGLAAYAAGPPGSLALQGSVGALAAGSLFLVVFVAGLEELIFRGLLLDALSPFFGGAAAVVSGVLFACVYVGSGGVLYVALVSVLGVALGFVVARTGSLTGAWLAHALFSLGLLVVWPALLG